MSKDEVYHIGATCPHCNFYQQETVLSTWEWLGALCSACKSTYKIRLTPR